MPISVASVLGLHCRDFQGAWGTVGAINPKAVRSATVAVSVEQGFLLFESHRRKVTLQAVDFQLLAGLRGLDSCSAAQACCLLRGRKTPHQDAQMTNPLAGGRA